MKQPCDVARDIWGASSELLWVLASAEALPATPIKFHHKACVRINDDVVLLNAMLIILPNYERPMLTGVAPH